MAHGTHDHADDPRNAEILIWVNGELLPRDRAVVSVFDSGFVLGDGVWEGLRVCGGHPAFLDQHLDRLEEGARAIMLDLGMTRAELTDAIYATLRANDMTDGVHVRLMVTRGVKSTPYQDPRVTIGPATVVIIAEHKEPLPATVTEGITLFTTHVRRATPDTLDPKLNAHSKLNDITAVHPGLHRRCRRGADARPARLRRHLQQHALLHRDASGRGVDLRRPVLPRRASPAATCSRCAGRTASRRARRTFSLTDVYSADEAFVTGTFAGVVPVRTVDGRTIGTGAARPGGRAAAGALPGARGARDVAARTSR